MARRSGGYEYIEAARALRNQARTAHEYRQALSVILPLEQGLSLAETAEIIGLSKGATSRIRNQFFQEQQGEEKESWYTKVLPERQAKEAAILDEVLVEAAHGGVVVIPPLKALIEEKLGKTICLATLYNMLHRHGWRKLAPDTKHPKGHPQAREEWKKNSPPT